MKLTHGGPPQAGKQPRVAGASQPVNDDETRRARGRAQWLTGEPAATATEVVGHLIGLQAQLPSAAALAVRARAAGPTSAAVDDQRAAGALVRTWLMRGTLHLARVEDLVWLGPLLAPASLRTLSSRHRQLGLDPATLDRSADVLGRALDAGPATRAELFAALAAARVDPAGQRGIHLVQYAALRGGLCFGADRGHEPTWMRLPASWPAELDREEALARLARRYRTGYGSDDPRDVAAWSGLPVSDARHAFDLLEDAGDDGSPHTRPGRLPLRLLPHFDPYLLGYRDRRLVVPERHRRQVWTGGGYVLPTVVVDGSVVGTWRSERSGCRLAVTVSMFDPDDLERGDSIDAEVADVGRFLGLDAARE
ncbi:MAG: winged helix DNA-binding domain-containing protein [Jiangellaceae bacterium]